MKKIGRKYSCTPYSATLIIQLIVISAIVLQKCLIVGFNVDLPSTIIHSSPQANSWFGYSVSMYKHKNINTLLVGAPKYNTTQPGVVRGGAVLRCSTQSASEGCQYVPFDNAGHSKLNQLDYFIDSKSDQLFGATLKCRNGIVVACAPRYVWFTASRRRREPVGTCYVARDGLTDFQEYSPCRTEKWGYHRQGSCQAGFDAALTNDGDRMYVGAPGAYYWQGQIHSQSLVVKNEYFTTGEGPAEDDDQYLGYSVASGDFNGDGIQDIALGVPKGLNYTGKVSLYSHNLQWLQNITGDQLGSYFGYCLSVLDFNGDSLDDIVVGAPLHTDFEDREMKIEVGKIHVLIQNRAHQFSIQLEYLGRIHRGRFGLSVASLGDINLDNYDDFAVGAPYSGIDGRGAVFIYHGFSLEENRVPIDVMQKPVQIIYASEVSNQMTTFGWSLSGGIDIDDNQYPDMLVGAYESGRAFLFKSRPIIKFSEHKLHFKTQVKTIDIGSRNCKIKRGKSFLCLDLEFCLAFTGVNVPERIELEIDYRLDTRQFSEQRLLFESNDQPLLRENIQYAKEAVRCRTLRSYLKLNIVDKLTPLAANVSYSLIERRRLPGILTPVLDRDQRLSMQDSLTIQKNCGPDNICIPDLVLTFDAPDEFIIGQKEMLNVSVEVENKGEDAFESVVLISEPPGLLFNKFEPRVNTSCSTRKIEGKNFVKCDIGNPLPKYTSTSFTVFFQQTGVLEEPEFDFEVIANCTNAEDGTYSNNVARKVVSARIDARITLFGSSEPESIIYNTSIYQVPLRDSEEHYGPSLVHKYGLLSKGPSAVQDAEIMILWPSRTLTGEHLLYIMEQPITVGNVQCENVQDVNPLNLKTISREERIRTLRLTSLEGQAESSVSVQGSTSSFSSSETSSFSSSSSGSSAFHSGSGSYYGSRLPTSGRHSFHGGTSYYGQGSTDRNYHSGISSNIGRDGINQYNRRTGNTVDSEYDPDDGSEVHYSSTNRNYSSSSYGSSGKYPTYDSNTHAYSSQGNRGGSYDSSFADRHSTSSGNRYSGSHSSFSDEYSTTSSDRYGGFSQGNNVPYSSTELSNQGGRSHLLLPATGSDGKFAATMFTVQGGNRRGGITTGNSDEVSNRNNYGYQDGVLSSNLANSNQYGVNKESRIYSSQYENRAYSPRLGIGADQYDQTGSQSAQKYYSSSYDKEPNYEGKGSVYTYKQYSSSSVEEPYYQNEIHSRSKRNTDTDEKWEKLVSECGATLCTRIRCLTGALTPNDDVYIYVRSRLWVDTLSKFKFPVDDVTITTRMAVRANVKPRGVTSDNIEVLSKEVVTPIRSAKSLALARPVPWWVILLATIAGLLILLIIIFVLWKLGFFERQRTKSS